MSTAWARPMPPRLTSTFVALTSLGSALADRDRFEPREPVAAAVVGGSIAVIGRGRSPTRAAAPSGWSRPSGRTTFGPSGGTLGCVARGGRTTFGRRSAAPRGQPPPAASRAAASSARARASVPAALTVGGRSLAPDSSAPAFGLLLLGPSVPSLRGGDTVRGQPTASGRAASRGDLWRETGNSAARSILRVGTRGDRHRRRIEDVTRQSPRAIAPRDRGPPESHAADEAAARPDPGRRGRRRRPRHRHARRRAAAPPTGPSLDPGQVAGREPASRRSADTHPIAHANADADAGAHADPVADARPDARRRSRRR